MKTIKQILKEAKTTHIGTLFCALDDAHQMGQLDMQGKNPVDVSAYFKQEIAKFLNKKG